MSIVSTDAKNDDESGPSKFAASYAIFKSPHFMKRIGFMIYSIRFTCWIWDGRFLE